MNPVSAEVCGWPIRSSAGRLPTPACLVPPGRQSLLHFEQVAKALFQPIRALPCDVIPGAGWELGPKGRNLFRARFII
jgi:hypothetical protein